jgi:phytoene dehydrogenase-like protein
LRCAGGYRFDTGPTVLTMPEVIGAAFASVGVPTVLISGQLAAERITGPVR